ncbi:hypothetical protein GCM10027586_01340 [Kineococcus gypseus]|uniref:type IV pilin protein n=1 Tax=Kineococcus gypseus TaxID=1637102 RepID=UPI003D7C6F25
MTGGRSAPAAGGGRDAGFALVELLVVMVVIGVLAAIAVPVMVEQRRKAADAGLKTDLRALAEAQETHYTDFQAYLPVAPTSTPTVVDAIDLSPGNSVSVTLNAGGSAYCVLASNPRASRPWVYVSSAGGQQPASVTACPASF